jgi:hypothetical protein
MRGDFCVGERSPEGFPSSAKTSPMFRAIRAHRLRRLSGAGPRATRSPDPNFASRTISGRTANLIGGIGCRCQMTGVVYRWDPNPRSATTCFARGGQLIVIPLHKKNPGSAPRPPPRAFRATPGSRSGHLATLIRWRTEVRILPLTSVSGTARVISWEDVSLANRRARRIRTGFLHGGAPRNVGRPPSATTCLRSSRADGSTVIWFDSSPSTGERNGQGLSLQTTPLGRERARHCVEHLRPATAGTAPASPLADTCLAPRAMRIVDGYRQFRSGSTPARALAGGRLRLIDGEVSGSHARAHPPGIRGSNPLPAQTP